MNQEQRAPNMAAECEQNKLVTRWFLVCSPFVPAELKIYRNFYFNPQTGNMKGISSELHTTDNVPFYMENENKKRL